MAVSIDRMIVYLWQVSGRHAGLNPARLRPAEDVRLFGLLDAARDERIYPQLMAAPNEKLNLFRGEKAKEMAWVAPYLVEFQKNDVFLRRLLEQGWHESWGIFMQSSQEFAVLKRHLRDLLQAYDEEGNSLFFRYYDPRVLRVYLPTCAPEELKTFFGPVSGFYVADEAADALLVFRFTGEALLTEKKLLS
jgi:hypothetical protein